MSRFDEVADGIQRQINQHARFSNDGNLHFDLRACSSGGLGVDDLFRTAQAILLAGKKDKLDFKDPVTRAVYLQALSAVQLVDPAVINEASEVIFSH